RSRGCQRRAAERAGSDPFGAVRRVCDGRGRARKVRHRAGPGNSAAIETDRSYTGSDRSGGAERGVRRAGARVPARTPDRSGSAERQRRGGRARPSPPPRARGGGGGARSRTPAARALLPPPPHVRGGGDGGRGDVAVGPRGAGG